MLRSISERTVYVDEEFCDRVIDWQKIVSTGPI